MPPLVEEEQQRSEMDAEAHSIVVQQNKRKRKSTSPQGVNRPGKQTERDKNSVVIVQETTANISATGQQVSTHMSTNEKPHVCLVSEQEYGSVNRFFAL